MAKDPLTSSTSVSLLSNIDDSTMQALDRLLNGNLCDLTDPEQAFSEQVTTSNCDNGSSKQISGEIEMSKSKTLVSSFRLHLSDNYFLLLFYLIYPFLVLENQKICENSVSVAELSREVHSSSLGIAEHTQFHHDVVKVMPCERAVHSPNLTLSTNIKPPDSPTDVDHRLTKDFRRKMPKIDTKSAKPIGERNDIKTSVMLDSRNMPEACSRNRELRNYKDMKDRAREVTLTISHLFDDGQSSQSSRESSISRESKKEQERRRREVEMERERQREKDRLRRQRAERHKRAEAMRRKDDEYKKKKDTQELEENEKHSEQEQIMPKETEECKNKVVIDEDVDEEEQDEGELEEEMGDRKNDFQGEKRGIDNGAIVMNATFGNSEENNVHKDAIRMKEKEREENYFENETLRFEHQKERDEEKRRKSEVSERKRKVEQETRQREETRKKKSRAVQVFNINIYYTRLNNFIYILLNCTLQSKIMFIEVLFKINFETKRKDDFHKPSSKKSHDLEQGMMMNDVGVLDRIGRQIDIMKRKANSIYNYSKSEHEEPVFPPQKKLLPYTKIPKLDKSPPVDYQQVLFSDPIAVKRTPPTPEKKKNMGSLEISCGIDTGIENLMISSSISSARLGVLFDKSHDKHCDLKRKEQSNSCSALDRSTYNDGDNISSYVANISQYPKQQQKFAPQKRAPTTSIINVYQNSSPTQSPNVQQYEPHSSKLNFKRAKLDPSKITTIMSHLHDSD
uniref:Trichohyalin-like n=1 Tax=Heterorhabditis bacteriophora TaxID=37862 RepID=A0A1I7X1M8_HETBA